MRRLAASSSGNASNWDPQNIAAKDVTGFYTSFSASKSGNFLQNGGGDFPTKLYRRPGGKEDIQLRKFQNSNEENFLKLQIISLASGFAKGWFPKGRFWQCSLYQHSAKKYFPGALPWQKKAMIFDIPGPQKPGMRAHSPKPPFTKQPFCFLSIC